MDLKIKKLTPFEERLQAEREKEEFDDLESQRKIKEGVDSINARIMTKFKKGQENA